MRILIRTRPFFPSIGGLEAVMLMLAEEFTTAGHRVTVVTETPNPEPDAFPFDVLRSPSLGRLLKVQRESDVVILGNISLWWVLELCLAPRPWIATHHGWYFDTGKPVRPLERLKVALAVFADANVSVSQAVNRFLGNPGVVIPNPYDKDTFRLMPEVKRDRDLVFLGRLVSDKGADILLDALAMLARKGLRPGLTVIGSGPDLEALQLQASRLGLDKQVTFTGPKRGRELAGLLNAHRIMVIPSRWNEPFGVVALEGIACGCVMVASNGGGLPEAVGPCGVTFPNNDPDALAARLEEMLGSDSARLHFQSEAPSHLARHDRAQIAARYLEVLQRVAA